MTTLGRMTTLKSIALELLQKYEESETSVIWEYSVDIKKSEKYLDAEVTKYRELINKYAEQEPKWIPVSERLPESAGVYIVTREFTDGFELADLTDACYFDGTSTWHDDNRTNHGREYVDKKIKAWMPLPEPYESQESEE